MWKKPENADGVLEELLTKNADLYRFEKMLEEREESTVSQL